MIRSFARWAGQLVLSFLAASVKTANPEAVSFPISTPNQTSCSEEQLVFTERLEIHPFLGSPSTSSLGDNRKQKVLGHSLPPLEMAIMDKKEFAQPRFIHSVNIYSELTMWIH